MGDSLSEQLLTMKYGTKLSYMDRDGWTVDPSHRGGKKRGPEKGWWEAMEVQARHEEACRISQKKAAACTLIQKYFRRRIIQGNPSHIHFTIQ